MPSLKCPQCGAEVTNPEILKNPGLLSKSRGPADPALDICTTCWEDLPHARISVPESEKVRFSTTTGTFVMVSAKGDPETADHPIPLIARKKRGQESPAETPPDTRWPELVAEAEKWAQDRPWELRIGRGHCFLVRARLLDGIGRDLAREASLRPIVFEPIGPVVSLHRKRSLQRYLPPGVSIAAIPEKRAKRGRRWRQEETTPSEWERDRDQYYHLRSVAYTLRGKPGGQEAAEAALLARLELSRKYKGARKCRMCQNFIPRTSKALYCKAACKERAKDRRR